MNLHPLSNRITVKTPKAPDRIGRLFIPPEAQETYTVCQAEIVAVGPGVEDQRLAPGLRIIVRRFGSFKHSDELWTLYARDIYAILN